MTCILVLMYATARPLLLPCLRRLTRALRQSAQIDNGHASTLEATCSRALMERGAATQMTRKDREGKERWPKNIEYFDRNTESSHGDLV
jgi:hypothetical protein